MNNDTLRNAIACNIAAIGEILDDAATRVTQAENAMIAGEQNQAIGSLLDLDRKLEDALALYRASIALHRRTP